MIIRRATPADVPAMLAVHLQAVRQTAAGFYNKAIIDAWSASSSLEMRLDTIARMANSIASGNTVSFVAEIDNTIAGFGELIPAENLLLAVYIHPDHGRKGVGSVLVEALETTARQLQLEYLQMDASLNAEAFYSRHGYELYLMTNIRCVMV